jgi:hypothetical protein
MQGLWSKILELIREHPILWLPFVIADLTTFFLNWLQKSVTSWIYHWLLTQHNHSVLGGDYQTLNMDQFARLKAALLSTPLVWGNYYLHTCLYTTSFVITAAFVCCVQDQKKPSFAEVQSLLRQKYRRLLLFALKLFGIYFLGSIIFMSIPMFLFKSILIGDNFDATAFGSVLDILTSVCVAWILTPAGIRLIQAPLSESISSESIKQGRTFAILAAVASVLISYFVMRAEASFSTSSAFDPMFHHMVISPLLSLFVALPYMLLWIAFSLLAAEQKQKPEIQSNSEAGPLP